MQIQFRENQDKNWFAVHFENGPAGILFRMGPDETENPGRTCMWVRMKFSLFKSTPSFKNNKIKSYENLFICR
jgi:hypothetical protein